MKKKYVLANRARFNGFLFIVVLSFMIIFLVTSVNGFNEKTYLEVQVEKGDTLWEIASLNRKRGDIRDFIYQIKSINNLDDSSIYPGMVLNIPNQ